MPGLSAADRTHFGGDNPIPGASPPRADGRPTCAFCGGADFWDSTVKDGAHGICRTCHPPGAAWLERKP